MLLSAAMTASEHHCCRQNMMCSHARFTEDSNKLFNAVEYAPATPIAAWPPAAAQQWQQSKGA
jgi:hypothetical protein